MPHPHHHFDAVSIGKEAERDIDQAIKDYTSIISALRFRAAYLAKKGHVETPRELLRLANVLTNHLEKFMALNEKILALVAHDVKKTQEVVDLKANPPVPDGQVLVSKEAADAVNGRVADDNTIPDPAPTPPTT